MEINFSFRRIAAVAAVAAVATAILYYLVYLLIFKSHNIVFQFSFIVVGGGAFFSVLFFQRLR